MAFFNRINPVAAAGCGLAVGFVAALAIPVGAHVSSMPNTFQSGETASAEEVNANFNALLEAVNGLEQELSDVKDENTDLAARLANVEEHEELFALENFVVDLDRFLEIHLSKVPDDTAVKGPLIRVAGANLQIVNDAGDQETPDGTGNLIVGFAQARGQDSVSLSFVCSDGQYVDATSCTEEGHQWSQDHNTGSHNIVGGREPAYSRTGGFVAGVQNAITGVEASATGGGGNTASGKESSVSGGAGNIAAGNQASVSGGVLNTAGGRRSSVSGGAFNEASGEDSSVSAGTSNTASGLRSSASGGENNTISGNLSTVSGGIECEISDGGAWGARLRFGGTEGDCEAK